MKEEKIKNRDSDSVANTLSLKEGMNEGQGIKTGFLGPWVFIIVILGVFLSPIGERFVGYLKFRSTRTALQIKCDDRGYTNACVMLSRLYSRHGYEGEAREYQLKVCDKNPQLKFCKESI
ncbi:MAG: hypothetical protein ACJAT2_000393 [Bacteriovoracaceae bacterium]|jgi:hypothetical protein